MNSVEKRVPLEQGELTARRRSVCRVLALIAAMLALTILGGCTDSASTAASSVSSDENDDTISQLASHVEDLDVEAGDLGDRVDTIVPSSTLEDDQIDDYLDEADDIADGIDRVKAEVANAGISAEDLTPISEGEGALQDLKSALDDLDARIGGIESYLADKADSLRLENLFRSRSKLIASTAKVKVADAYMKALEACNRGLKGATAETYIELSKKCIDYFGSEAQKRAMDEFDVSSHRSRGNAVDTRPILPTVRGSSGNSASTPATSECTDFSMSGADGAPGAGYFDITVRNIDCSEAKRIILENADGNTFASAKAEGFECVSLGGKGETYQFRCATPGDAIAFRYWFGS